MCHQIIYDVKNHTQTINSRRLNQGNTGLLPRISLRPSLACSSASLITGKVIPSTCQTRIMIIYYNLKLTKGWETHISNWSQKGRLQ